MDILALIAAFGGGAFAAGLGALPAFIMTGFLALVGTGITLAGGADILTSNLAFGSFFGPHIAFAGAAAATAYAARKNNTLIASTSFDCGEVALTLEEGILIDGTDITYSLGKTLDGTVLIVGGVFGMIGYLVNYLYSGVLHLNTDTVAMTVATLGLIARFTIGKSGLTGQYTGTEKRQYFSQNQELIYNIVVGLSVGIMVSCVAAYLKNLGVSKEFLIAGYPSLCFGISAITLVFAQMGFSVPITHHISLPAANAAVLSGNPIIGVVVAIACSLIGDFFTKTINSYVDTHIDPPACTIFIMEFIVFGLFM
nr:hypothetical protein [uncultured Terrisporobacter sp.]